MKYLVTAAFILASGVAEAQGGMWFWEEDRSFVAISTTAMAITGDITLSGQPEARVMTVATGARVDLSFIGNVEANWSLTGAGPGPGGVYDVIGDPGAMLNDNSLCGAGTPATFVVFSEDGNSMQMAAFSGAQPESIDSPGLCGTYSYAIN
ncbi:hypothetical protein [Tabrizicola sp.]|uniref:hypothetical protein n=1 Tax=Tabrizicola sp. TaxID=2005166 RepID=UPI003F37911E